jgi:ferrochelatase
MTGVLFLNMGGPDGPDDVRPFLTALFSDNDIIPLPLGSRGMRIFGWLFGMLRAPYTRRLYALIGGGSPQRRVSEQQGRLVAGLIEREAPAGGPWKSYLALRYTRPSTDDAIRAMRADGIERLVVVPLYPQFSSVTTGSSQAELARGFTRAAWMPRDLTCVRDYHDDPAYLDALAASVNRALSGLAPEHRSEAVVIFSAHALPMRVVERGDLYPEQVRATVAGAVHRLAHRVETRLSWQSQARPFTRWLEPRTDEAVVELGRAGKRTVLMVPIAFVQEHIETLYEMDILYGDMARAAGIERFVRVPALGEDPAFISALAGVVRRAVVRDQA